MLSSTRLAWFAVGSLVVGPGAGAADNALDAGAAAKGQITYARYCVPCHGPTGKADGPLAADLRVPVPDLTSLAARSRGSFPYDRVVRIVKSGENVRGHGTADMPAWGDAFKRTRGTDEDSVEAAVRNLAHYLWSIQPPAK
jgi:mono/diheme cytochrome c family protein